MKIYDLPDLQGNFGQYGGVFVAESLIVPTDSKLTTRADCALTSVCRVAAVVNRRLAQPAVARISVT